MLHHINLFELLRARVEDLREHLDLGHHDIDRLFNRYEAFRRHLLILLWNGQFARAWALGDGGWGERRRTRLCRRAGRGRA